MTRRDEDEEQRRTSAAQRRVVSDQTKHISCLKVLRSMFSTMNSRTLGAVPMLLRRQVQRRHGQMPQAPW